MSLFTFNFNTERCISLKSLSCCHGCRHSEEGAVSTSPSHIHMADGGSIFTIVGPDTDHDTGTYIEDAVSDGGEMIVLGKNSTIVHATGGFIIQDVQQALGTKLVQHLKNTNRTNLYRVLFTMMKVAPDRKQPTALRISVNNQVQTLHIHVINAGSSVEGYVITLVPALYSEVDVLSSLKQ